MSKMVKVTKNLLAFLTIFPVKMDNDCLVDSANYMFIFPLIGAFLGLLAGIFGWALSLALPALVVGGLVLGLLLLLTGLHHTDGLLDFGDAVMAHGTPERKIEIMHDQFTGAGALSLGVLTILVTAFAISSLTMNLIIQSLIIAEVCAKLSMVVGCWAGKPIHKGMNSPFLEAMHGRAGNARMVAALLVSFSIAILLLWFFGFWIAGFIAVLVSVLTGLVMVAIAHKHFKGVTGDVLGATNELTRMIALITLIAIFALLT